ncbi:hypothetical protein ASE00_07440 [Sphingomonas sp. Root710]|uniref:hypothetical protein n=1 Tax=Sphingomonas sp. Root710 TaxID=1736594 RepID=UPI0007004441|nr:hypothetical protein [Sphingomonas sp. Root710]KRB86524.1 hypothetical protein ASE00_07440 [Sphingomonas sp. Root710]
MDIQAKVAARRAELEQQAKLTREQDAAAAAARMAAQQKAEEDALEEIAVEISSETVQVVRDGDGLAIVPSNAPEPLDMRGMKKAQIERLFRREARKAWTPGENWLVIGSITAGACLIFMPFVGIPLLVFGLWRRSVTMNRHKERLRAKYADLAEQHRAAS